MGSDSPAAARWELDLTAGAGLRASCACRDELIFDCDAAAADVALATRGHERECDLLQQPAAG